MLGFFISHGFKSTVWYLDACTLQGGPASNFKLLSLWPGQKRDVFESPGVKLVAWYFHPRQVHKESVPCRVFIPPSSVLQMRVNGSLLSGCCPAGPVKELSGVLQNASAIPKLQQTHCIPSAEFYLSALICLFTQV